MTPKEPRWLTAIYSVVGLIIIVAGVAFAYLVVSAWPIFLMLGAGWAIWWWQVRSPAARERQARDKTAVMLRQLAALEYDFPSGETFADDFVEELKGRSAILDPAILDASRRIAENLLDAEAFTLSVIPEPPALLDSIEGARYRQLLANQHRKLADRSAFDAFRTTLLETLSGLTSALPQPCRAEGEQAGSGSAALRIGLIDVLPDVARQVEDVILSFYAEEPRSLELFSALRGQLDQNLQEVSAAATSNKTAPKSIMPTEYTGDDVVRAYLHHTPLEDLFRVQIPFNIPEETRFEHAHILAGSGHGKTQTLQHLLISDLTRENSPSLVVIDSQGDMLRKISRLSLFDPEGGPLASKIVIIDPSDVEHPPALNMFDVNVERLGGYGTAAREQILNGVIELYDYIFGSLLGAELTQKQSVIFRYLARLMLTIPGATIHTLIELMNDATPFMKNIEQLPPGARMFFETEFPHKSFTDTKRQIQRRLWGILENPTFERMLTAPKNRIDMFDALNTGKIVLVNTAKDFLKAERSSFLGRFFIALTLQAALERAAVPEGKRRPAFLYIDEAADYFDSNIDDLLTQARKYNLGVIFSHQYLDQLAPGLRSSIASNTSIKLAGGISDRDARSMAPDMRTTPTFLLEQRKREKATQFGCYLRNVTPHALSLSVPFGTLEAQPTMGNSAHDRLREGNRSRVSVSGTPADMRDNASAPALPAYPAVNSALKAIAASANEADWSG
jgi:hypothetical protein